MFMSIVLWAQVAIFTHVMSYDVDWDRLGTMGRAPRTWETLPDFRESGRVTRHSRIFRRLTGSQRTLGFWGSHGLWQICIVLIIHILLWISSHGWGVGRVFGLVFCLFLFCFLLFTTRVHLDSFSFFIIFASY